MIARLPEPGSPVGPLRSPGSLNRGIPCRSPAIEPQKRGIRLVQGTHFYPRPAHCRIFNSLHYDSRRWTRLPRPGGRRVAAGPMIGNADPMRQCAFAFALRPAPLGSGHAAELSIQRLASCGWRPGSVLGCTCTQDAGRLPRSLHRGTRLAAHSSVTVVSQLFQFSRSPRSPLRASM